MDIESLHKYISLVKLPNDNVEVSFSGQLCLTVVSAEVSESHFWRINPVFAKLVYGANVFTDIPDCLESYDTVESAVAAGLVKLHELGAFNTEVDLPEDTYAATIKSITEDVNAYTISRKKSLMEALAYSKKLIASIYDGSFVNEDREYRSEYAANIKLRVPTPDASTKLDVNKHKIKNQKGEVISAHSTESGAITAFNNLKDKKGIRIVKEEDDTEIDITPIVEKKLDIFSKWVNESQCPLVGHEYHKKSDEKLRYIVKDAGEAAAAMKNHSPKSEAKYLDQVNDASTILHYRKTHNLLGTLKESVDDDYSKWEDEVKKTHPTKKLKFKGRIESGVDTISAEEPNVDRSYGVWDNKKNTGTVFKHED